MFATIRQTADNNNMFHFKYNYAPGSYSPTRQEHTLMFHPKLAAIPAAFSRSCWGNGFVPTSRIARVGIVSIGMPAGRESGPIDLKLLLDESRCKREEYERHRAWACMSM